MSPTETAPQQATLHYRVLNLTGDTATRFDKWINIATTQGLTQTGHYAYDAKKKTLEALNLQFEGAYDLVRSLHMALGSK